MPTSLRSSCESNVLAVDRFALFVGPFHFSLHVGSINSLEQRHTFIPKMAA